MTAKPPTPIRSRQSRALARSVSSYRCHHGSSAANFAVITTSSAVSSWRICAAIAADEYPTRRRSWRTSVEPSCSPSTRIVPFDGCSYSADSRTSVVLPDPFAPSTNHRSPGRHAPVDRARGSRGPSRTNDTPTSSSAGAAIGVAAVDIRRNLPPAVAACATPAGRLTKWGMATDLVIEVENEPGALARVAAAISDAGVNIAAATCVGPGDRAELHILVPHAEAARHSLAISHLGVTREREVVVVDVQDRPGVLADLTRKIAKAGVNLDLVYVATNNRANLLVRPDGKIYLPLIGEVQAAGLTAPAGRGSDHQAVLRDPARPEGRGERPRP